MTLIEKIKTIINRYKRNNALGESKPQKLVSLSSFSKEIGLEITDFEKGINPQEFRREALDGKSMMKIFGENEITSSILKKIYHIYGDEIVLQYMKDSILRNSTVLMVDEKHDKMFAPRGLQDHITMYSEQDFSLILQKFFNREELSKKEKYIVVGMLAKMSDLIGLYGVYNLMKHSDYIKKEIDSGIFNDIVVCGKKYSNRERNQLTRLSKSWDSELLEKYKNLPLLKKRIASLPKTDVNMKLVQKIDEIMSSSANVLLRQTKEISSFIDDAFMEYEAQNRINILSNVYNPDNKKKIVISDLSEMNSCAILHFFDPKRNLTNFENYLKSIEEKRSNSTGKKVVFTEDEKKSLYMQYKSRENHYLVDQEMDFEGIGQIENYGVKYLTNTSNQLSTMFCAPNEILQGTFLRSNVALGFSINTVNPELMAVVSRRNIHSNKGIDYIETNNQFEEFSASFEELTSRKEPYIENTELVFFRESVESSLKPSYVMYVASRKIDSDTERKNIEEVEKQMKEVGLDVPLVIFDRYSMRHKENIRDER